MTATTQQSETQQFFLLSGATTQKRISLLERLLIRLERQSIKTLVVRLCNEKENLRYKIDTHRFSHGDLFIPAASLQHSSNTEAEYLQSLRDALQPIMCEYDLVLCDDVCREGQKDIVLRGGEESLVQQVLRLPPGDNLELMAQHLYRSLQQRVDSIPVWGCLLMRGRSSRMGRPKHLIETGNSQTWIERSVTLLREQTEKVVLAGRGEVPHSLAKVVQLHDIPSGQGPLAGILAAMRWNPDVNWIVSACDMPLMSREGLSWLLAQRKPGVWGIVPRQPMSKRVEPLLAYYDAHSRMLFERLFAKRDFRVHALCEHPKIDTPQLPSFLADAWRNCNTPEDVGKL